MIGKIHHLAPLLLGASISAAHAANPRQQAIQTITGHAAGDDRQPMTAPIKEPSSAIKEPSSAGTFQERVAASIAPGFSGNTGHRPRCPKNSPAVRPR
jgi:hypothetical protein